MNPLGDRFWKNVKKTPDGCWEWIGSKKGGGYGNYYLDKKWCGAHRLAYQETYGEIPPGKCVCHRCDNPSCVRPEHLFLGSQKDNLLDCISKGRARSHNKEKSNCVHGHPLSGENLFIQVMTEQETKA